MGWSKAYHYHLNKDITITEVMKLRIRKDPRAGDIHCHKECFESKTGSRLQSRKKSSDGRRAHFARWPRSYTKDNLNCGYQAIADSKRESMDYANYYSNFESFLNEIQRASEPYFFDEVDTEIGELMPDFVIRHSSNTPYEIVKTQIHIVDENNRRGKQFVKSKVDGKEAVIVIRISEYTLEQLNDFQRGGIERLELEWEYVLGLISEEKQEIAKIEAKTIADRERYRRWQEKREELRVTIFEERELKYKRKREKQRDASEKKWAEKWEQKEREQLHYVGRTYGSREHCESGCKSCQDEKKALDRAEEACQNMKKSQIFTVTKEMKLFYSILQSAEENDESVSNFLKEPINLRIFFNDFKEFLQVEWQFGTDVVQFCRKKCKYLGPRGGRCKAKVQDYSDYCPSHMKPH